MLNLFKHTKETSAEFQRLNTLVLRQAKDAKDRKAENATLKAQLSALEKKVK